MTNNMQHTSTDIRPGTYTVDTTRSSVEFTATHVFGLKPVHGTMIIRYGTVTVAGEPRRSTVSAELDATTFTTDDERRNRDIRGKRFLDVERFPVIGFRSTRLARTGDGGWQVIGELAVRGGSTEVALELTGMEPAGDGYRMTATTTVDRVAAGVATGRAIIGRLVTIRLSVVLTAA
jgi:polyisoprenoid-binding protein YceI